MSDQQKSWWNVTGTLRQSLTFDVLWLVIGLAQVVDLRGDDAAWWRWALVALMVALAGYYLLAWWVRRRRKAHPRRTEIRRRAPSAPPAATR